MVRLDPDHAVMPNLVIIWERNSQTAMPIITPIKFPILGAALCAIVNSQTKNARACTNAQWVTT